MKGMIRHLLTATFLLIPVIMNSQPANREFRLAMVQMYVEPGALQKNLDHAVSLIADARAGGADVVLLPEVMDLGWTHPSARELAGAIPGGRACTAICNAARENNVYVCCGIVEKDGANIYNAAIIIDNNGNVLIKHRKLNELDIAHEVYDQGDRLNVCRSPWGTFGLMICADANANDHVITRSLCYMGADVILSPSSWAVRPDHDNKKDPYGDTWRKAYMPVAERYRVWIASASNVGPVTEGPWKDWNCIGCSLLVGPDGKEKLMGPYGRAAETILYYNIKPESRPARGTGWSDR
jgi:predicted amidohydrolase